MSNLADRIERYIKGLLEDSQQSAIEIQRQHIASVFGCVPSQINYVLATRFAAEQGYLIESRRGGGGYVRIVKLTIDEDCKLWDVLTSRLGESLSQDQAERLVNHMVEEEILTIREGLLIRAAMQRDVLQEQLPQRDKLRSRLMKAMLYALFRKMEEYGESEDKA